MIATIAGLFISLNVAAQNASFPLESVTLEETSLPKQTVLDIAGLRIGAPVDKEAIEAACKHLQESGLFQSINYRYAPSQKNGYLLTLALSDQPALSDAVFDLPGFEEDPLWQWLVTRYPRFNRKVSATGDAQAFIAKEVEQHLGDKLQGRHVVTRMETDLMTGKMLVSFQPDALPKIAALNFTGQTEFQAAELATLLHKALGDDGYTERRFRQAVEFNLRPAYEQRGMYRVKFPSITMQPASASSVYLTTVIEEGPKFTLGEVQLVGDNLPANAMLKAAKFRKGELANWAQIQNGIWETEKPLKRAGYLNANARPERIFHDDQYVLDLKISFLLGPLYHFGELRITGLTPPLEGRARKIWSMKSGDPFDYAYANDFLHEFIQSAETRQFRKIGSTMQKGSGDHVMDVLLTFER